MISTKGSYLRRSLALAAVIGEHGLSVGDSFARLVGATYLGLGVMAVVIIPGLLLLARIPFRPFLLAAREPVLIAIRRNRHATDQVHDEVWPPRFGGARVEVLAQASVRLEGR